jgi:Bardet-Biedl syndrome 2 protein
MSLEFNPGEKRLELVVGVGNPSGTAELALRSVVVYSLDAGIFGSDRESCVVVPTPASSSADPSKLRVPIAPTTNISAELRVQALVGQHHSNNFFAVVEQPYRLPKFAMFQYVSGTPALAASVPFPRGSVVFATKERATRVATWIAKVFPVRAEHISVSSASPSLEAKFLNLRTGNSLVICVSHEHGGQVTVGTDEIDLAGEIVQDLTGFLSVHEVEAVADFPDAFAEFRRTLQRMEECMSIRNRLTGDSAVAAGAVKTLVIQAEDSRLLADMPTMKRYYGELRTVHGELLGEYAKRAANHTSLVVALKDVNQMIQRTANLRGEHHQCLCLRNLAVRGGHSFCVYAVGDPKTKLIAACRNCIKNNTPLAMMHVMQTGKTT